ncbi:MAG: haloacid dehalogenase type II [Terriglobales bacterium]
MDFSGFTTVSFDCYGTLIDWEAGILPTLRGVLATHGRNPTDAALLELYGEFEAEAESGQYQSYRNVLESVVERFGDRFDFRPSPTELRSLHRSIPDWPPFPDTVAALRDLQKRYKLAVISNIDDDLFAATRKHLGVDFDCVVSAQQARSYKPSVHNFQLALRTMGVSPDRLLHAAQSIYHDVIPAQSLGIASVWVNRKSARPGVGAVRAAAARPNLEVPDLATLAALAGKNGPAPAGCSQS